MLGAVTYSDRLSLHNAFPYGLKLINVIRGSTGPLNYEEKEWLHTTHENAENDSSGAFLDLFITCLIEVKFKCKTLLTCLID